MDPAPGRTSTWLTIKAPEVLFLGGAIAFGVFGAAVLISNPAGNGTSGENYGPDAPLQPWVVCVGALLLIASGLCLLVAVSAFWKRFARRSSTPTSPPAGTHFEATVHGRAALYGEHEDDILRP